jgi:hypothetical protein
VGLACSAAAIIINKVLAKINFNTFKDKQEHRQTRQFECPVGYMNAAIIIYIS